MDVMKIEYASVAERDQHSWKTKRHTECIAMCVTYSLNLTDQEVPLSLANGFNVVL